MGNEQTTASDGANGLKVGVSIPFIRMLIGFIFFRAGTGKLFGWSSYGGWAVTKSYFEEVGIPSADIVLVSVGWLETICGALLILGLKTRLATIPLILLMFGAIVTVHREVGALFPLLIYVCCFILLEHGSGRFSLDHRLQK